MMTERDSDLMERYIYEVVRRVPGNQRKEITMELEELIGDMAEESEVEEVLTKLGDPILFARKYRNENSYMIGPEYYDNYLWILKIVMSCVLFSTVLSAAILGVMDGSLLPVFAGNLAANVVRAGFYAFGIVTLIFFVLEKLQIKFFSKDAWSLDQLDKDMESKTVWNPKQLKPVPVKKAVISRRGTVISITFNAIATALLLFSPQLFGAYLIEDGILIKTVSIFNLDRWNVIMPVFLTMFLVTFFDEIVRLMAACYNKIVMISRIACNILQLILSTILLKVLVVWNPNYTEEIADTFGADHRLYELAAARFDITLLTNVFLAFIALLAIVDTVNTMYRTKRYG